MVSIEIIYLNRLGNNSKRIMADKIFAEKYPDILKPIQES